MSHGWPGPVLEFLKLIGPLTNPRAHGGDPTMAFDVVAPSMPGFGFSEKPANTGWNMDRIADAYVALMGRLGYERWGMQGGDLGCAVSDIIARKAPDGCIGMHLNFAMFPPTPDEIADADEDEPAMLASATEFWDTLSAMPRNSQLGPGRSATPWLTRPPAWPRGSTRCSETPAERRRRRGVLHV